MTLRLFVAIDVPGTVKDAIERDVVGPLRDAVPGARWTRPDGRHLTLAFLGNVDDDRVSVIADAVSRAVRDHAPFDARFEEVGGFPSLHRPRVLWVGIGEGAEAMSAVQRSVATELEPLGFGRQDRPFTAHVTLARFPRPRPVGELPAVEVPGEPFTVDGVVLYRSQLHPKGARYTSLERFTLGG